MPKTASKSSAVDKTKGYIRKVLKSKGIQLKFTSYQSKNCIIYKLNKFHYLDNQLYVVDQSAIKYLGDIFRVPNFVELIKLELCNIGDEGAVQFAKGNWQNVKFLTLGANNIKKRGIDALVAGRFLQLKEISLNDNSLDPNSVQLLQKANWVKLQKMNLNFNYLGNEGLINLEKNTWKSLKQLCLLNNGIGNKGIISLVNMKFPNLQKLYLSHNYLTNDSAKIIIKGLWKQLKILQLDGNKMGDDSLIYLCKMNCFKLQKLHLFASMTVVINTEKCASIIPTMGGLKELCKGHFQCLKMQIHQGKLGQASKQKFIKNDPLKDGLENCHVQLIFVK